MTAWSSPMLPFHTCWDDRNQWCCMGGQYFGCKWQPDVERSGVENAGFLLGIDETGLKFVSGLRVLKAPTPAPVQWCCAGWVLCCGLVTDSVLSLQRATAMGAPRSATSTLSCTAPRATAATAPPAPATPTGPTASAAATASTAWPATRPACPAAATPSVSRTHLFFGSCSSLQTGLKREGLFGFLFFFFLPRKYLLDCILV